MNRILAVSVDGHSGGPPELYADYTKLDRVAGRIDLLAEEILGDHTVDTKLIENFHERSGYLVPAK